MSIVFNLDKKIDKNNSRGKRAELLVYDECSDLSFEPEGNIIESHIDENGIVIIDKFEITGISAYAKRKREEKQND